MINKGWSDSELVSRYQNGNEGAFEILLHRHKSRVYTAIYMIVKDRYKAEDLLQETFIKAINTIKSGRYNDEGKFSAWIESSTEDIKVLQETHARLRDLIKELPKEQKRVLIMRHYLHMSFQEIADRTGVSINTALGRMRYALINLRKKMETQRAYDKNFYPERSDTVSIPRDFGTGDPGD